MQKSIITVILFLAFSLMAFVSQNISKQQGKEPWTEKQLLSPEDLVKSITGENAPATYIYNIGPSGHIKNSIDIGPGKEKSNIEKLRKELIKLPKEANIVIYCGCCPFGDCPNIRPAFSLLNEMKFNNHKLLYLPKNLKVDWIDKGYPMSN